MSKQILDACCGSRMFWFDKENPNVEFCDIRELSYSRSWGEYDSVRHIEIHPDTVCDFTDLPFEDKQFKLVVFDPPHILNLKENAWYRKAYGSLDDDWREIIKCGFDECMRVLRPDGTLIFKWADTSISTPELIKTIGTQPLFGHRSGKKANTHWLCFMKNTVTQ